MLLSELVSRYPAPQPAWADSLLDAALERSNRVIVVLDDDPTGVQTVHDVPVYTDWRPESLRAAFDEPGRMFFILTNSRSFSAAETAAAHKEIAQNLTAAAQSAGKDFLLVSRGDSTLRGHWPLETDTLRKTLEESGSAPFDGEIICPFFKEGGRYTAGNIHYVAYGDELVPAGETEFAQDKTFGYTASALPEWVQEKTRGQYNAAGVTCVSLDELRAGDIPAIARKLQSVSGFGKVIVNALDETDLKLFCAALYQALDVGKRFLFRTAAGFVKALGGISSRPLLTRADLLGEGHGGLIIAGSHTKKTTSQLEALNGLGLETVVLDQRLALEPGNAFANEVARVSETCNALLRQDKLVCVCTRRERVDAGTGNPEDDLRMAVRISDGVTAVVSGLTERPRFLIAKGGITSSDVGTKGLLVKRALVAGQAAPGVPVWLCGQESRFPGLPYVIFPGNVGEDHTLRDIVEALK